MEKITRSKIYDMPYWKEKCFGVSAETLVDLATDLRAFGGITGGNNKACDFLCLTLKMLQIQPEREIVLEFIRNEDYKYVRCLGAFYLRLTGKPLEVYEYLEPLLNDYRKIRYATPQGKFQLRHVDEFVHDLLSYKGMAREAKTRMIEAEKKKAAKAEAKAAKAAAKAAQEAAAEGESTAKDEGDKA